MWNLVKTSVFHMPGGHIRNCTAWQCHLVLASTENFLGSSDFFAVSTSVNLAVRGGTKGGAPICGLAPFFPPFGFHGKIENRD